MPAPLHPDANLANVRVDNGQLRTCSEQITGAKKKRKPRPRPKPERNMSQSNTNPPPEGGVVKRAPMKARRGGSTLGGKRVSQQEIFRYFTSDRHHVPKTDTSPSFQRPHSMSSNSGRREDTGVGMRSRASTEHSNHIPSPEPAEDEDEDGDLDMATVDAQAQSLLNRFLRSDSSAGSIKSADSRPASSHTLPNDGSKRLSGFGTTGSFSSHGGQSPVAAEFSALKPSVDIAGSPSRVGSSSLGRPVDDGTAMGSSESRNENAESAGLKGTIDGVTGPCSAGSLRRTESSSLKESVVETKKPSEDIKPGDSLGVVDPSNTSEQNILHNTNDKKRVSQPPYVSRTPYGLPFSSLSLNHVPTTNQPIQSPIVRFMQPYLPRKKPPPGQPRGRPGPKPKQRRSAAMASDSSSSYTPSNAPSPNTPERRPRRSRAAPTNYYAKVPGYYGYEDEEEEEASGEPCNSPDIVQPEEHIAPPPPDALKSTTHTIYQDRDIQIQRVKMTQPTAELFIRQKAPYRQQKDRKLSVGKRKLLEWEKHAAEKRDTDGTAIIHADFDESEMKSIYFIMTGATLPSNADIPLPDLLTQAARKFCPQRGMQMTVSKRLSKIKDLLRSLRMITLTDPIEFLPQHRNGSNCPTCRKGPDKHGQATHLGKMVDCLHVLYGLQKKQDNTSSSCPLQRTLRQVNESDFNNLIATIPHLAPLKQRGREHIRAFLTDAANGFISSVPCLLQPISSKNGCGCVADVDELRPSALLRSRELGHSVHRARRPVKQSLATRSENLEAWKTWKGASNDVMHLAWSPDGTRFAAGATSLCDTHNMVYNRNNNLLLGDLTCNSIKELPDHNIPRPTLQNSADPKLYMSLSAVSWLGDRLYTASYDHTVKVWDATTHDGTRCIDTLPHKGRISVMAVSDFGSIATGCEETPYMKVWNPGASYTPVDLPCSPTKNVKMTPSVLRWGSPYVKDFLVAGMAGQDDEDRGSASRNGYLSLWQMSESCPVSLSVSPNAQNIFDVVWDAILPIFATGSSVPLSGSGISHSARSLVRIYEPLRSKSCVRQYECPASDINEVTFCPWDNHYITASCTDEITYVWDYRNPSKILHKLTHGPPIAEQDPDLPREQSDTGVCLALWRHNKFYTGGSDGVLKKWDILRAPEDVLLENTASFEYGIISGAFSPDYSNLLVGDSSGGIHVLSSAPFSRSSTDTRMNYEPAEKPDLDLKPEDDDFDLGTRVGNELLSSRKLSRHPTFGVGQGPNYDGPYAAWARAGQPSSTPLLPEVQATQLDGPPVNTRNLPQESKDYINALIQIAQIRNQQRGKNKRKGSDEPESMPPSFLSSPLSSLKLDRKFDTDLDSKGGPRSVNNIIPRKSLSNPVSSSTPRRSRYADRTHDYIVISDDEDDDDLPRHSHPLTRVKVEPTSTPKRSLATPPVLIDLTEDTDDDPAAWPSPSIDEDGDVDVDADAEVDALREALEDDHWWPGDVDANIGNCD
ncbi:hypothetical protein FQN50_002195 [Emmonsiellopsis sp. PD_5]|nr:hypothetical protein FQN50_002195 [Emmonsiellopsis sp. PD_5]